MAWQRLLAVIFVLSLLQWTTSISSQPSKVPQKKSLCQQYHRVNVTKRLPSVLNRYQDYYDSDGQPREETEFADRIIIVTGWNVVEMCCEGYEPSQDEQSSEHCVPVCSSKCENGICERPNSCLCDPGYVASVDNITRISSCLPHCSSGCKGGTCIAPETCSCGPGYHLANNSTSCKPSCTALSLGGVDNCGVGGICVVPNGCQCQDGYILRQDLADYHPIWMHRSSTKRSKLIFYDDNVTDCIPICDSGCPINSTCEAPNRCSCNVGYRANDPLNVRECFPICEQPCHNGFCKAPNVCECNDGYKPHHSLGSTVCEPRCRDKCVNGECVQPNNVCRCLPGFERLNLRRGNYWEYSTNICVPVCQGKCGNGFCIAPNTCNCSSGYNVTEVPGTPWQTCTPSCEPHCNAESVCVAPNRCQLNDVNVDKYPSFKAEVVDSFSQECGPSGLFHENGGAYTCKYPSNITECIEPLRCAIIITNGSKSAEGFRLLEKVVFWDKKIDVSELRQSKIACRNSCRISIFSNQSLENIRDDVEQCYAIHLDDPETGIVFDIKENLVPITGKTVNESFICFVNDGFRGDVSKEKENNTGYYGTIVGVVFLLVIILALALASCLMRNKIRKLIGGSSQKNTAVTAERWQASDPPFEPKGSPRR